MPKIIKHKTTQKKRVSLKNKPRVIRVKQTHSNKSLAQSATIANAPRSMPSTESPKDTISAAQGILDPWHSYANAIKTGLPFQAVGSPVYGLWSRNIRNVIDIPYIGAAARSGTVVAVLPWCNPQMIVANALDAGGAMTSSYPVLDPQMAVLTGNFERITVAYQGLRVRNITPIISMAGESNIGDISYVGATNAIFETRRLSATGISHANSDPGVMLQNSFLGSSADSHSSGAVYDYTFASPTASTIDNDLRCMVFSCETESATPQTWEVEVITYYVCTPFANNSSIFAPQRFDVYPHALNGLLDRAYSTIGRYSIARNMVKDDGLSEAWGLASAGIKAAGGSLIKSAASWVGNAWDSLFGKNDLFPRILHLLPSEHYSAFRDLIMAHDTREDLLAKLEKLRLKETAIPQKLLDLLTRSYLSDTSDWDTVSQHSTVASLPAALTRRK